MLSPKENKKTASLILKIPAIRIRRNLKPKAKAIKWQAHFWSTYKTGPEMGLLFNST
jgi:hypothetical protein